MARLNQPDAAGVARQHLRLGGEVGEGDNDRQDAGRHATSEASGQADWAPESRDRRRPGSPRAGEGRLIAEGGGAPGYQRGVDPAAAGLGLTATASGGSGRPKGL